MSIRLMTEVWALDLPHSQQAVLLALADHAHDDGFGRPGLRYLAWKTGYSHRQVRRIVAELEEARLVAIHAEPRRGHATIFQLRLDRGTPKPAFKHVEDGGTSWPPKSQNGGTSGSEWGDTATTPLTSTRTVKQEPSSSAIADTPRVAQYQRDLCETLADRIEENTGRRPAITKKWLSAARLLFERDHRAPSEALSLVEWCQRDDFWRANILSMPTFRRKYDQLLLQSQRRRRPRGAIEEFDEMWEEAVANGLVPSEGTGEADGGVLSRALANGAKHHGLD